MTSLQLGRYQLIERLAAGGTAEVFKAKLVGIEGFEKPVVIKRILPQWSENPHFISMLVDEAKIMVNLNHERVVQVYELAKEQDEYYLAMEYVNGVDLRHLMEAVFIHHNLPTLTKFEILWIIRETLKGLVAIHSQKDAAGRSLQIIHRDLSPHNILLSVDGQLKITDFGIAHAAIRSYETATGLLKGKFAYMAPEQARGEAISAQTDLFALGIIAFELLTGTRLFQGKSDLEILNQVRSFDQLNTDTIATLSAPLLTLLQKALESRSENRYPSAQSFLNEVQLLLPPHFEDSVQTSMAQRVRKLQQLKHKNSKKPQTTQKTRNTPVLTNPIRSYSEEITRDLPAETFNSHAQVPQSSVSWVITGIIFVLMSLSLLEHKGKRSPVEASFDHLKSQSASTISSTLVLTTSMQTLSQLLERAAKPVNPLQKALSEISALKSNKIDPKIPANSAMLPEKTTPDKKPPISGKGYLSVMSSPWGQVTIPGVASGKANRFFEKALPYGNYSVQVAYQLDGQWYRVARAVAVNKPRTQCSAFFRGDGKGSLSCR